MKNGTLRFFGKLEKNLMHVVCIHIAKSGVSC